METVINDCLHAFCVCRLAKQFMQDNGINWWQTPAESPDCNPIENLWHELKEFVRREVSWNIN